MEKLLLNIKKENSKRYADIKSLRGKAKRKAIDAHDIEFKKSLKEVAKKLNESLHDVTIAYLGLGIK